MVGVYQPLDLLLLLWLRAAVLVLLLGVWALLSITIAEAAHGIMPV